MIDFHNKCFFVIFSITAFIMSSNTVVAQNTKDCALLIEGVNATYTSRFPEIEKAIDLAQQNKCDTFDPIHSFDYLHLSTLIAELSDDDRKALAVGVIIWFNGELSTDHIINTMVKDIYHQMYRENKISAIPAWVTQLTPNLAGAKEFITKLAIEGYEGSFPKLKVKLSQLLERSSNISNELSFREFEEFVSKNPEITKIYGLIGSNHISFIDEEAEEIFESTINYRFLRHGNADIKLYGGIHGELKHYIQLANNFPTQTDTEYPYLSKKQASHILDGSTAFRYKECHIFPKPLTDDERLNTLIEFSNSRYACSDPRRVESTANSINQACEYATTFKFSGIKLSKPISYKNKNYDIVHCLK